MEIIVVLLTAAALAYRSGRTMTVVQLVLNSERPATTPVPDTPTEASGRAAKYAIHHSARHRNQP